MEKKQFTATAVRWFDRMFGNTYHSVRILRHADGAILPCRWRYGYEDHYRQTAIEEMAAAGWIPAKYAKTGHLYERENGYPISWSVSDGLKREMIANGRGDQ